MEAEKQLKVSVIMPAYNSEKYIERSIKSVLSQTHSALELIVVDDGSTDRTPAILRRLASGDSRLRVVRTENHGPALARNVALEQVAEDADFVTFIDADDELLPDALSYALEPAGSGADLILFGFSIVEADGKRLFARHYVPSPKESCWTNLVLRPGGTEWGGCLKEPVRVGVPACERLSVRVERGDWLELKALEIAVGGQKASLPFSSEWSTPLRQEMRFAGFGASSPFVPLDGKHYTGDDYLDACKNAAWKPVFDAGQFVMVGEFGVLNKTPHNVALRWMEDNLRRWKKKGIGWALWNFRGAFGILDSNREDVQYEDFHGHKLDRKMLELLQRY